MKSDKEILWKERGFCANEPQNLNSLSSNDFEKDRINTEFVEVVNGDKFYRSEQNENNRSSNHHLYVLTNSNFEIKEPQMDPPSPRLHCDSPLQNKNQKSRIHVVAPQSDPPITSRSSSSTCSNPSPETSESVNQVSTSTVSLPISSASQYWNISVNPLMGGSLDLPSLEAGKRHSPPSHPSMPIPIHSQYPFPGQNNTVDFQERMVVPGNVEVDCMLANQGFQRPLVVRCPSCSSAILSPSSVYPEVMQSMNVNQQMDMTSYFHPQYSLPHPNVAPFTPSLVSNMYTGDSFHYQPFTNAESSNGNLDYLSSPITHSSITPTSLSSQTNIIPNNGLCSPSSFHSTSIGTKQTSFGLIRNLIIKRKSETNIKMNDNASMKQINCERPESHHCDEIEIVDNSVFTANVNPMIEGYLHKLTRNGVWQRRFFDVIGGYLTYYKNHKRSELLATLDLANVGAIDVDKNDPAGCTFTIQVASRLYYLRAEDSATCKDWVINLNRVREARIEIGGLRLCSTERVIKYDSRKSQTDSGDYAPPIVPSNLQRPRAHNIDADSEMKPLLDNNKRNNTSASHNCSFTFTGESRTNVSPSGSTCSAPPSTGGITTPRSIRVLGQSSPELYAQWEKRQTKLQQMRSRLANFINWMTSKPFGSKEEDLYTPPAFGKFVVQACIAEDGATAAETTVFSSSTSAGSTIHNTCAGLGNTVKRSISPRFNATNNDWISKEQCSSITRQLSGDGIQIDPSNVNQEIHGSHNESGPRII